MLNPTSPVLVPPPNTELAHETIIAGANRSDVQPLPLQPSCDLSTVLTRWSLTLEQRRMIASGADVYLEIYNAGRPVQPVMLHAMYPYQPEPDLVIRYCVFKDSTITS